MGLTASAAPPLVPTNINPVSYASLPSEDEEQLRMVLELSQREEREQELQRKQEEEELQRILELSLTEK